MAKRDILKTAEKAAPGKYGLTVDDCNRLKEIADNDLYETISIAFKAGFVLGARAQKSGAYKERRAER